jgi:hypothetical protein
MAPPTLALDAAPVKGVWLVGEGFPVLTPVPVGFEAEPVPVGYMAAETVPLVAYDAVAVAARAAAMRVIENCILMFVWWVGLLFAGVVD